MKNLKLIEHRAFYYFTGACIGILISIFFLKRRNAQIPEFKEHKEIVQEAISLGAPGALKLKFTKDLSQNIFQKGANFFAVGKKIDDSNWKVTRKENISVGTEEVLIQLDEVGDFEVRAIISTCNPQQEVDSKMNCDRYRFTQAIKILDSGIVPKFTDWSIDRPRSR